MNKHVTPAAGGDARQSTVRPPAETAPQSAPQAAPKAVPQAQTFGTEGIAPMQRASLPTRFFMAIVAWA